MSVRKVVEVVWFDAQSSTCSWSLEELKDFKPVLTKSCGYLLVEEEDYIILGFTDFGDGLIKHNQCIPRGMIKEIKVLRGGAKK